MTSFVPAPVDKQSWRHAIGAILTKRRLSYGVITGAALWLAWLASIILGPGNFDLANQVVGTDYLQFYAAGITLQQGDADWLYDFNYQSKLEVEIAGEGLTNFHAFLTPPFLAWLFIPLSQLPYLWSFLVWSILGLLELYASIKLLGGAITRQAFLWSLTWFPIFAVISFGQNSILSLLILCLSFHFWKTRRTFLAGMIASLIMFKPQLIAGVVLLWLLRWRKDWKALLGLMAGSITLATLTYTLLPTAAEAYLKLAREFLPNMVYSDQFPLYHLHTLRGFCVLLFPKMEYLSDIATLLLAILLVAGFIWFTIKNSSHPVICFGAAIAITILVTPHAMIYDWSLLLIPALLLWNAVPQLRGYWKVIFAIIWLVLLLSGPLTYLQRTILPVAVQLSVPVFLWLLIDIHRTLKQTMFNAPNVK